MDILLAFKKSLEYYKLLKSLLMDKKKIPVRTKIAELKKNREELN